MPEENAQAMVQGREAKPGWSCGAEGAVLGAPEAKDTRVKGKHGGKRVSQRELQRSSEGLA